MSLKERLDHLKEQAKTRIPAEAQAVMQRAIEDTRSLRAGALEVGATAPDFTLPSDAGAPVTLRGLLARGPVVLSFFRGQW